MVIATVIEVAQVVGPVFTAVAALAACIAVLLTWRERRLSHQPVLRIAPLANRRDGRYGAAIMNAGDGPATGVYFVIADCATVVCEPVLQGFLRPGEYVEIYSTRAPVATLDPDDRFPIVGFVTGRDRFGFAHDWTTGELHALNYQRPWRSGFRKEPKFGNLVDRLVKWFPSRPHPDELEQIAVSEQNRICP